MPDSGGIITYNFREGFRSEYLAHYVFSAFGPSMPILREDDFGIDILCNSAHRVGVMMTVKGSYGVQIKSSDTEFVYKGRAFKEWLKSLEFPLILAEVSKIEAKIKIYSTWKMNYFLISGGDQEEVHFVETKPEVPNPNYEYVEIGSPILEFDVIELGDKSKRDKYHKILDEWIELDRENYKWRKAHIPYVYGYFKYTTNESFYEKTSEWAFNFVYSPPIFNELKSSFTKAATAIAVHCKGNGFDEELGLLKAYVNKYCDQYLDDFGKEQFK